MTLLPNINNLKSCRTSFKNLKNFLKISVMFSAVFPKLVEKLLTIFFGFSSIFENVSWNFNEIWGEMRRTFVQIKKNIFMEILYYF